MACKSKLFGFSGKDIASHRIAIVDSTNANDETAERFKTLNLILQEV
jgi:hypothetical protein